MQLTDIVFYLFALLTILSACVVVFSRNVVYAAFALLFTFMGIAGLYVLLYADFLAVTQILIYVGGILVLILFGVMLTSKVVNVDMKTGTVHAIPALILTAVVGGTLAGIFYATWKGTAAPALGPETTTPGLGTQLMTSFVLPFEIASVILVVALVGAAMTARRSSSKANG
jgi:NADH-quinone oxidoreductase subunit J